ncbi:hypothetical protein COS66_00310 [Candidatus Berkelbacteria bacterium CG06_land_8_20_14_3_00_43_10]|nr:MAG: hypothetical protein COS66_00310 [Candidatus Berkelbacteria bacterium CG06_land_8_20_14_3_00_43_10]
MYNGYMVILIVLATVIATVCGGLFAMRFKDKLHLILGFSAGAVIGVAFFNLLPESLELGKQIYSLSFITSIVALGFLVFMMLDRLLSFHDHSEDCDNKRHNGRLGAGSLSLHSLLDGVAIGLSFNVSQSVGIIVAIAVLAHDFSDGINTVGMILKSKGSRKETFVWLGIDSIAPVIGIISTYFFTLSQTSLGLLLALFCGFFLYIGASDLLPESHHGHPARWTSLTTLMGALCIYIVVRFVS